MDNRRPDNTDYFVRQLMKQQKRIYAFILTLVGNSSDADDIMQDTAALMWQKYHQSEHIMDFAALGVQIAHFKVLEFRKKQYVSKIQFNSVVFNSIPGGAAARGHWETGQDGSMDDYIRNIDVPHVKKIFSNYGKISVLWWDTPENMNRERGDVRLPLLSLQPGIIWNNRLGGGYQGDSETPEGFISATVYPGGRDWQTCMTINNTWGYKSWDTNYKSIETLIRNLIDIASKGGNYLLKHRIASVVCLEVKP